jgi:hypothetical protein
MTFTLRDFDPKTLSWWYDQRNNIDFTPSYQRKGKIWTDKDKSYLIDSILNGFDIPKIYIADFTFFSSELNEKRKPYAVVDGKQRFEAMFDFYDDKITLDKDFILLEEPSIELGGLSFKDLKSKHPELARKVENFNLSVRSIITDSEGMINELFIRLNKSKPLTGAELRTAMKGVIPKLLREIIALDFFTNRVKFNTKRGQDANVAAKLLLTEFRGKFVDTKKIHLDKLADDAAKAEVSDFTSPMNTIKIVLEYMNDSFIDKDPLLSTSGLIPVYYWLYRTYGKENKGEMRNFLVQFDEKRKENRKLKIVDINYVTFDRLSKNSNDQSSLQGCYNILELKWKQWKLKGKL